MRVVVYVLWCASCGVRLVFCAQSILINGWFYSVFFCVVACQVQQDGMSHGCIFARKFGAGTCPVNVWRTVCGVAAPAVDDQDTASALTTAATPATTATTAIPFTGERDVLVIVCAGDTSLHDYERWYASDRTYDLCVVYYGNDAKVAERYQRDSDHYHAQQGPKWQLIRAILKKGLHTKYKYIWMPVRRKVAVGSFTVVFRKCVRNK